MKKIVLVISALSFGVLGQTAVVANNEIQTLSRANEVIQHGGGCRKSSPPGMCCHMDNSTGTVHCH